MEDNYSCELKYFDSGPDTTPVDSAGFIRLLFAPVEGTDYTQRIGRKTVTRSIYIRGKLEVRQLVTALPAGNVFIPSSLNRLILFIDWQPNGATPLVTDVLRPGLPEGQLNPDFRRRFTIIKDKQFTFECVNYYSATKDLQWQNSVYDIKMFERINMETIFKGTNFGDIRDIASGALYMLYIGSNTHTVVNPVVQLNASYRCRFEDC